MQCKKAPPTSRSDNNEARPVPRKFKGCDPDRRVLIRVGKIDEILGGMLTKTLKFRRVTEVSLGRKLRTAEPDPRDRRSENSHRLAVELVTERLAVTTFLKLSSVQLH